MVPANSALALAGKECPVMINRCQPRTEGKELNRLLGVPKKYRLVIAINVGVPHPDYKPPRKVYKPFSKWIFKERWPAE